MKKFRLKPFNSHERIINALLAIMLVGLSIFLPFSFINDLSHAVSIDELNNLKQQNEYRQKQLDAQISGVSQTVKNIALKIDSISNYEIPKSQIELRILQEKSTKYAENAEVLKQKLKNIQEEKLKIEAQSSEMYEKLNTSKQAVKSAAREEMRGENSIVIAHYILNNKSSEDFIEKLQDNEKFAMISTRLTNRFLDLNYGLMTKEQRINAMDQRISQLQIQNELNIKNTAKMQVELLEKVSEITKLSSTLANMKQDLDNQLNDLGIRRTQNNAEHAKLEEQMNDAVKDAVDNNGGLPIDSNNPGSDLAFDAGYIISDSKFYTSNTLSVSQIQAFLDEKGINCHVNCLKDYHVTTDQGANSSGCSGYPGGQNLSAAQVISAVAIACNISEKVLITMLQKEQGLITMDNPASWRYTHALGFACPDDGSCNLGYGGLYSQLYSAAWQFNYYKSHALIYNYKPFMNNNIQYHPNVSCGYAQVYIRNYATAGLYVYTPYTPNAAAISAGLGTGDSCSSYGNRNFYYLYLSWFGNVK